MTERCWYHSEMRLKYRAAPGARRLPIAPDPPEPQ